MSTNLSPMQIEQRLDGITATDIAAIVGVHPYRSAVDVWSDKTGKALPFDGNERTKWGNILEPVIRRDYEERRNVRVEVPGTIEREWMRATPDGIVYEAGSATPIGGLEIKCHTIYLAHLYGPPGSDEVPAYELCQCSWNMAVTGLRRWDLVAFIDGQPRDYTIEADDELIEMLEERAERFLVENIRGRKAPDPDGSTSFDAFLKATFKQDNAKAALKPIDDDPMAIGLVAKLRDLRDQIHDLERVETETVQAIKLLIGDLAGIDWEAPRGSKARREHITWKQPKSSLVTDWQKIASEHRTAAQLFYSAKGDDLRRATLVLDKLADEHFANSRATMTGAQLRDLLAATLAIFEDLATDRIVKVNTKLVPNSRTFRVPASWKRNTKKEG